MNIKYEDFIKVDIRSGTIIKAEEFPRTKKPAYKVWVDFGAKLGILQTSAQITQNYTIENLIGQQIIGCINLGEKNIAGFKSQFLLVGFEDAENNIILCTTTTNVPNGQKLQ